MNLCKTPNKVLANTKDGRNLHFNASMFKYDTDYTAIFEVGSVVDGTSTLHIQWRDVNGGNRFNIIDNVVSNIAGKHIVYKFKQTSIDAPLNEIFLSINVANPSTCTCEIKNCVILEGDHTQNPPSYFEGLKSVGQSATTSEGGVDEIVVSSCYNVADIATEGNTNFDVAHIKKGVTYSISSKRSENYGYNLILQDKNGRNIKTLVGNSFQDFNTFVSDVDGILFFNSYDSMDISEIMLLPSLYTKETMPKYKPYAPDKKRILYYNNETQTWEKPILREWDSIEKHANGKYYYHQRSGEVVLDGSENWQTLVEKENVFWFKVNLQGSLDYSRIVCDKLNSVEVEGDYEGIFRGWSSLAIGKNKLLIPNLGEFKLWLQANNVTVVYQLAQEKVYECTNIDLITYSGETNYIVSSGAIVPKTTLKVHNNISNVVKILQEKVSLLENKFIQGLKKVLAGDMYSLAELLYPEDFVEENPENNIMLLPFE